MLKVGFLGIYNLLGLVKEKNVRIFIVFIFEVYGDFFVYF